MKSETQKLISNLKKEIEEINKKETITQTDLSNYNFKKSQLQFAEKLIEAIKEDVENRLPPENYDMSYPTREENEAYNDAISDVKIELNKILDEIK